MKSSLCLSILAALAAALLAGCASNSMTPQDYEKAATEIPQMPS
jgi:type IV pilus biogenesis protein CpaD/CtpE